VRKSDEQISNENISLFKTSMMSKIFFLCSIALLLFSCSSSDDGSPEDQFEEVESFYPLQVGNSWVYEYFNRFIHFEEFDNAGITETVSITGTTVLNGETYYQMETNTIGNDENHPVALPNGLQTSRVRDSLGYLVTDEGRILFSSEGSMNYFVESNDLGEVFGNLIEGAQDISVNAGEFNTIRNDIIEIFLDGSQSEGSDKVFYSENIGLIIKEFTGDFRQQHRWEKRLMSFVVN